MFHSDCNLKNSRKIPARAQLKSLNLLTWLLIYTHLISKACYTTGYILTTRNGTHALKRGQVYITLRGTARALSRSYSTVKRAIDYFEQQGWITVRRDKHGTLITFLEYDLHYPDWSKNKHETPKKQPGTTTPRNTGPESCTKTEHETLKYKIYKNKTHNAHANITTETKPTPPAVEKTIENSPPRRWSVNDLCLEKYGKTPENPRQGIHPLTSEQYQTAYDEMRTRNRAYDAWEWRQQNSTPKTQNTLGKTESARFSDRLRQQGVTIDSETARTLDARRDKTLAAGYTRHGRQLEYAADADAPERAIRSAIEIRKAVKMGYDLNFILRAWGWCGWVSFNAARYRQWLDQRNGRAA